MAYAWNSNEALLSEDVWEEISNAIASLYAIFGKTSAVGNFAGLDRSDTAVLIALMVDELDDLCSTSAKLSDEKFSNGSAVTVGYFTDDSAGTISYSGPGSSANGGVNNASKVETNTTHWKWFRDRFRTVIEGLRYAVIVCHPIPIRRVYIERNDGAITGVTLAECSWPSIWGYQKSGTTGPDYESLIGSTDAYSTGSTPTNVNPIIAYEQSNIAAGTPLGATRQSVSWRYHLPVTTSIPLLKAEVSVSADGPIVSVNRTRTLSNDVCDTNEETLSTLPDVGTYSLNIYKVNSSIANSIDPRVDLAGVGGTLLASVVNHVNATPTGAPISILLGLGSVGPGVTFYLAVDLVDAFTSITQDALWEIRGDRWSRFAYEDVNKYRNDYLITDLNVIVDFNVYQ